MTRVKLGNEEAKNPKGTLFLPGIPLRMPARLAYGGVDRKRRAMIFNVVKPTKPGAPINRGVDGVAFNLATTTSAVSDGSPAKPEPYGVLTPDYDGSYQYLAPSDAASTVITALLIGLPIEYDTLAYPNGPPTPLKNLLNNLVVGDHVGELLTAFEEMKMDATDREKALRHIGLSLDAFRRTGSTALYEKPHVPFPWSPHGGAWFNEDGQPVLLKVVETIDGTFRLEDTIGGVYEPVSDPATGHVHWQLLEHAPRRDRVDILSAAHYSGLQRAMRSPKGWSLDEFPSKKVRRGKIETRVQLRPPDIDAEMLPASEFDGLVAHMDTARRELTDADVDTLDALTSIWIDRATGPEDRIEVSIDELLERRGIQRRRGGTGRRGGYTKEKRDAVRRSLWRLHNAHVAAHVDVTSNGRRSRQLLSSPAFVFTGARRQFSIDGTLDDVSAVNVIPGDAFKPFFFGAGRQVAVLSTKALEYHARHERIEKRLARYLAYRWRCGAVGGQLVQRSRVLTLVEEVSVPRIMNQPQRQRDRLEAAINRLEADCVIAGWQYADGWSDSALPRRGWLPAWYAAIILIEAPEPIKEAYSSLVQTKPLLPPKPKPPAIGTEVRERRKAVGITQLQLAEALNVSQPALSQAENGRACSKALANKLRAWLDEGRNIIKSRP